MPGAAATMPSSGASVEAMIAAFALSVISRETLDVGKASRANTVIVASSSTRRRQPSFSTSKAMGPRYFGTA